MNAQPLSILSFYEVLRRIGWLEDSQSLWPAETTSNLLPLLLEHCAQSTSVSSMRRYDWLESCLARGAALRLWPLKQSHPAEEARLLWCPYGLPDARRIGILSSRLGRRPDELREWFQLLRAIVEERAADEQFIIAGTTTARPWLEQLFGTGAGASRHLRVIVECPGSRAKDMDLENWLRGIRRCLPPAEREGCYPAFLSPPLETRSLDEHAQSVQKDLLGDRVILCMADDIYLLRLMNRGRLRTLLERFLDAPNRPSIQLCVGPRLVSADTASSLCDHGCKVWRAAESGPRRRMRLRTEATLIPERASNSQLFGGPMLTHWTRAASGAWPDQSEAQFRNDLLFDRPSADRSTLAALLRIISMRRLCASNKAIRGGYSVVCFTAVPFEELVSRPIFRPHRCRWDFSPYGICISQEWLQSRGARPVIYGDDGIWRDLDESEEPFFQAAESSRSKPNPPLNWAAEREWRVVGDIDLRTLPSDQAFVFAPSWLEARWLAFVSRWPVRVIPITAPALSLRSGSVR